jgi:hypothetical protein
MNRLFGKKQLSFDSDKGVSDDINKKQVTV